MRELSELREELDAIDRKIVKLYQQRMEISEGVAEYKIANGKMVLDRDRDLNKYLHTLFTDAKVLEERNVEYKCDCSRERFMASLLTLPKKDIEDLSKEEKIEVHCEFCNKRYEYSKEDLQTVLSYADRKCEDN